MAYGHNREGDCSDIETLVPVEADSTDAIIGQAQSLNPKGKTLITALLIKAAEGLNPVDLRAIDVVRREHVP